MVKKWIYSPKMMNKTRCLLTVTEFNNVLEVLAMTIRQEKEIKDIHIEKKNKVICLYSKMIKS